jgi:hypothetical protein
MWGIIVCQNSSANFATYAKRLAVTIEDMIDLAAQFKQRRAKLQPCKTSHFARVKRTADVARHPDTITSSAPPGAETKSSAWEATSCR